MTTKPPRTFLVQLDPALNAKPVYLGVLSDGVRQGATRLENAELFTFSGARRVAKGYTNACAVSLDRALLCGALGFADTLTLR